MWPGRPLRALFGAVLGTALLAVADPGGVERRADDLVPDARQVLDAAASHEDDRVLLEIVAFARDVGRDLHLVRQADARNLPESRIRLLRGMREHARADAALLRRSAESRGLRLPFLEGATLADELVDGGHEPPGKSVLTQQRSAGPIALPTGRGMVAKPERARKPRKPASGAEPEGLSPAFDRAAANGFSYLQKLVRRPERHYSESAGFTFPAANE